MKVCYIHQLTTKEFHFKVFCAKARRSLEKLESVLTLWSREEVIYFEEDPGKKKSEAEEDDEEGGNIVEVNPNQDVKGTVQDIQDDPSLDI